MARLLREGLAVADVPMKMPDLAAINSTVKVVRWLVGEGRPVRRGDHLVEVETDKAILVLESALAGMLKAILAEPGQEVPTGGTIALFEVEGAAGPEVAGVPPAVAPDAVLAPPGAPASRPPGATGGAGGSSFARNRRAAPPRPGGDSPRGGGDG